MTSYRDQDFIANVFKTVLFLDRIQKLWVLDPVFSWLKVRSLPVKRFVLCGMIERNQRLFSSLLSGNKLWLASTTWGSCWFENRELTSHSRKLFVCHLLDKLKMYH